MYLLLIALRVQACLLLRMSHLGVMCRYWGYGYRPGYAASGSWIAAVGHGPSDGGLSGALLRGETRSASGSDVSSDSSDAV